MVSLDSLPKVVVVQVLSRTRITARCRDVDRLGRKKARARCFEGKENAHSFAFFFGHYKF